MSQKTRTTIIITTVILIIIIVIGIIIYQNTCLACKMKNANKNCDNDERCTSLKEQLKDPKEVFLLSTSDITIPSSKQGNIYFGVKNVFSQSLVLYTDITCNKSSDNKTQIIPYLDKNKMAIEKNLIIPYKEIVVYSIYINAPKDKGKYDCILTLYNDILQKETFSQNYFTMNII